LKLLLYLFFPTIIFFSCHSGSTNLPACTPQAQAFMKEIPWFPLGNVAPPTEQSSTELLKEISDTAAQHKWDIQTSAVHVLDLFCERSYSFVSKGKL
jgi:hypothetical protein